MASYMKKCSVSLVIQSSSVQSLSCIRLFATLWIIREKQIKITIGYHLKPIRWLFFFKDINKCWQLHGDNVTLRNCCWGCKTVQSSWKMVWWFLNKLTEKEMATHSSVLAWRIAGTEEPGGLPSVGSHRVGHDWSDLAATAAATS